MSREPTRLADLHDAASPEAAFMRDLIRAQRRQRPPDEKMQDLASRLGPLLRDKGAATFGAMPWLGLSAAALLIAAGVVWAPRPDEQRGPANASVPVQAPPELPPDPVAAPDAPPAVPVEALPNANPRRESATRALAPPGCDEVELVDRADARLRSGDANGALAIVREHEQRCSSGLLLQERERIAIEALANLGRVDATRARARSFEERFPASPHLRRVRQVLARLEASSP